jgi:hypothetical protein
MYFDFGHKTCIMDLRKLKTTNDSGIEMNKNHIIVGGGGLIHQCHSQMEKIGNDGGKNGLLIGWSLGHNSHFIKDELNKYPSYLNNYHLLGIRDYNTPFNYIPCVSCMNTLFDKQYEIKYPVGIYSHGDNMIDDEGFDKSVPHYNNFNPSLEFVLNFIGSCEVIVTNTFHGLYWAMLLKRRVICVSPFSTRFSRFKYKFPIIENIDEYKDSLDKTYIYDNMVDECRQLNIEFFNNVKELL